MLIAQAVLLV